MTKIYTTEGCGKCAVIKKLLTQQGIPFEEVSGEEHAEELKEMGYTSFPVIHSDQLGWLDYRESAMMLTPCKECKIG